MGGYKVGAQFAFTYNNEFEFMTLNIQFTI